MISNENKQLKQEYDEFQDNNNLLINENYNLTNRLNELEKQSSLFQSQQRNSKLNIFHQYFNDVYFQWIVSPSSFDTFKQMTKEQTRHTPIEEVSLISIVLLTYFLTFRYIQLLLFNQYLLQILNKKQKKFNNYELILLLLQHNVHS